VILVRAVRTVRDRCFELGDLLFRLGKHRHKARPIEADLCGVLLELHSAGESRERDRHIVEAWAVFARTALGSLLGLDALPQVRVKEFVAKLWIGEHVRVPTDHFLCDRIRHISELEALLFRGHLGVIDDLEQEIAELVLQGIEVSRAIASATS
jgi:hypothetical protein